MGRLGSSNSDPPEFAGDLRQTLTGEGKDQAFLPFYFLSNAYSIDHIDPGRMYMLAR